jgi:hypothetical protein
MWHLDLFLTVWNRARSDPCGISTPCGLVIVLSNILAHSNTVETRPSHAGRGHSANVGVELQSHNNVGLGL